MTALDDLRPRMAVVEARLAEFADEMRRTRDRLHDVENDRMAVRLLQEQVKNLERTIADRALDLAQDITALVAKVEALPATFESIAKRAGREAAEDAIRGGQDSRAKVWSFRVSLAVAVVALIGVLLQAWVASRTGAPAR